MQLKGLKMDFLALLVFIVVQIIFIPFAIVGEILIFFKHRYISKKLGVSGTAIKVSNIRWIMDVFGIRKDIAAVKLNRVLPNNSLLGMWLLLFPLYLRNKISGKNKGYPFPERPGEEVVAKLIINRTVYFDNLIDKSKDNVEQFVVMGAGFDTRCYGELTKGTLNLFELDLANTQKLKIEYLKKAGVDTSNVAYVEVNFITENWYEKLEAVGYNPDKKSLFLWEGVTLYLPETNVRKTLKEIKEHAASGSVILADFYALSLLRGELYPGMKTYIKQIKITNEEFGFGLDFSSDYKNVLKTFVESENITIGDTYFMGYKTKKGTFMVVAEMII